MKKLILLAMSLLTFIVYLKSAEAITKHWEILKHIAESVGQDKTMPFPYYRWEKSVHMKNGDVVTFTIVRIGGSQDFIGCVIIVQDYIQYKSYGINRNKKGYNKLHRRLERSPGFGKLEGQMRYMLVVERPDEKLPRISFLSEAKAETEAEDFIKDLIRFGLR